MILPILTRWLKYTYVIIRSPICAGAWGIQLKAMPFEVKYCWMAHQQGSTQTCDSKERMTADHLSLGWRIGHAFLGSAWQCRSHDALIIIDTPRLNRSGLLPSGAFDPQVQRVLQALEVLALEDNGTITSPFALLEFAPSCFVFYLDWSCCSFFLSCLKWFPVFNLHIRVYIQHFGTHIPTHKHAYTDTHTLHDKHFYFIIC